MPIHLIVSADLESMVGEGTYVTMEEPCSGIIRSPPNHYLSRRWDGDCISPCWVLLIFNKRRVDRWIVGCHVKGFGDYLEFVTVYQSLLQHLGWVQERGTEETGGSRRMLGYIPMKMEWMESVIPIIYRQLNIRPMGIRDRVRLMSIYCRVE